MCGCSALIRKMVTRNGKIASMASKVIRRYKKWGVRTTILIHGPLVHDSGVLKILILKHYCYVLLT